MNQLTDHDPTCAAEDIAKGVKTWEVLLSLGFQPGRPKWAMVGDDSLFFDFGGYVVYCFRAVNRRFRKVISFGGVWNSGRSLAEVDFELPMEMTSREQGVAWLVDALRRQGLGQRFEANHGLDWLAEGSSNKRLLPWVAEQERYVARPLCAVQRDWLKLAFGALTKQIVEANDDTPVVFTFDGRALSIEANSLFLTVPAKGVAWEEPFSLPAGRLRHLPKRLMRDPVIVSVWESALQIGGHSFGPLDHGA